MSFVPISATKAKTTEKKISIVEQLPDGDFIVAIDGVEYRAVTAKHVRQMLIDKAKLQSAEETNVLLERKVTTLESALELAKSNTQLSTTKANLERERAEKFKALWEGEKGLREQAQSLIRSPNRATKFFDNPFVQFSVKLGIPTLQSYLTAARC